MTETKADIRVDDLGRMEIGEENTYVGIICQTAASIDIMTQGRRIRTIKRGRSV